MCFFFFFNDTATTEIYTLSLHDALPILLSDLERMGDLCLRIVKLAPDQHLLTMNLETFAILRDMAHEADRKSTRLNSSHANISYAVFCLKKKKKHTRTIIRDFRTRASPP